MIHVVVHNAGRGVELDGQSDAVEQAKPGELMVKRDTVAACAMASIAVRQLGREDTGLRRVDAEIAPNFLVMVLRAHPAVAHGFDLLGESGFAAGSYARVAGGAEIFD